MQKQVELGRRRPRPFARLAHGRSCQSIDGDAHPRSFAVQHQVRRQHIAVHRHVAIVVDGPITLNQLRRSFLIVALDVERRARLRHAEQPVSQMIDRQRRTRGGLVIVQAPHRWAARRSSESPSGVRFSIKAPTPNGPDKCSSVDSPRCCQFKRRPAILGSRRRRRRAHRAARQQACCNSATRCSHPAAAVAASPARRRRKRQAGATQARSTSTHGALQFLAGIGPWKRMHASP